MDGAVDPNIYFSPVDDTDPGNSFQCVALFWVSKMAHSLSSSSGIAPSIYSVLPRKIQNNSTNKSKIFPYLPDPEALLGNFFSFFGGAGIWTQGFALTHQMFYPLSNTSSPFCSVYFGDGISQAICLGWLWTSILRISARIIGTNHQSMADFLFQFKNYFCDFILWLMTMKAN
jgi:hypothetical protein